MLKKRDDYYPFGLSINALSSSAPLSKPNKYNTYLGQERIEDFDLGWYEFKWRNSDPQIGRFFGVDPITEDYPNQTPYQFASNNPIWKVEIEGLEGAELSGDDWVNGLGFGVDTGDGTAIQPGQGGLLSKGYLTSAANTIGDFFGSIGNAISGAIESGLSSVMGTAEPNTIMSNSEFSNALGSGDEDAFFAGLEQDAAALYNAIPAAVGEAGAIIIDIAVTELAGPRMPSGDFVSNKAPVTNNIYKRPSGATTTAQRRSVQGKPCVDCGFVGPVQVADHITPLVQEFYQTGTIDKVKMRSLEAVQPQCSTCSARQGAEMSQYSKQMKKTIKERTGQNQQ